MVARATAEVLVVTMDAIVAPSLEEIGNDYSCCFLIRPNARRLIYALHLVQPKLVIAQLVAGQDPEQPLGWITLVREHRPWVRRIAVLRGYVENLEIAARASGVDAVLHTGEQNGLLRQMMAEIMLRAAPFRALPAGVQTRSAVARSARGIATRWSGRGPPGTIEPAQDAAAKKDHLQGESL